MGDKSQHLAIRDKPTLKSAACRINIRRATIADLSNIVGIWLEGAEWSFGRNLSHSVAVPPRDFFRSRLEEEEQPFGYWIAEAEGQVAGWQSLLPCRPGPVYRWGCSSTYVTREYRSRGVGKALLSHVTSFAKAAGLSRIEGLVRSDNTAAIRIIESLGWQKIGDFVDDDGIIEMRITCIQSLGRGAGRVDIP